MTDIAITEDSLLQDPTPQEAGGSDISKEEGANPPSWFYDEDIPGNGDAPDYLINGTFKTIAEQARGYNEIRKKLSGFSGAPEEYELKLSDELSKQVTINQEDSMLKSFTEYAKKINMNQEAYNEIVNLFAYNLLQDQESEAKASKEHLKKELESLGAEGPKLISELNSWKGTNIPEEFTDVYKQLGQSAQGIKFLNYIKGKMVYNRIPVGGHTTSDADRAEYAVKLKEQIADKRFGSDMQYTNAVNKRYEEFYGNGK